MIDQPISSDEQVAWRVDLAVMPGQLDKFLAITSKMVDVARHEQGVLSYQRFINSDGTEVHVYERYANSEAALSHLRGFREVFAREFSQMVTRSRFIVYGQPSAELRAMLDVFGATSYFGSFGNVPYWA